MGVANDGWGKYVGGLLIFKNRNHKHNFRDPGRH